MRFLWVVRVAEIEFFLSQRHKSLRSLESLGYLESFVADISTWSFGYLEYFVTTQNTPATKWKPGLRASFI